MSRIQPSEERGRPTRAKNAPDAAAEGSPPRCETASGDELFLHAPIGYLVLDESGTIRAVNLEAARLIGERPDALQGTSFSRCLSPRSHECFERHSRAVFAGTDRLRCEVMIQPTEGVPLQVRLECVATGADGAREMYCVVVDIHDLKNSQEETQASHERLRMLFELCRDGFVVVQAEHIRQANPAACQILGYQPEQLLGMSIDALQVPPGCPTASEMVPEGRDIKGEWAFIRPDGQVRILEFDVRGLSGNERMAFIRDITDRKKAEEQLLQYSEHLEELVELRAERIRELERHRVQGEQLAATGRMAARIAHEINNPLAGIKNSFLLVKDAIAEDYPYFRYVAAIEKEIDRIARIVSQMFDLYQPDQEQPQRFNLRETVDDVILMLEPLSRLRQVNVSVRLPEYPLILFLPEGLVRQVLYNLIANAIEASPPEETVKVAALPVGEEVSITVADHGRGITEEVAQHLFEPFFTTKRAGFEDGVGLGLSVSRTLVELMRGSLTYQSKVGEGTAFRAVLPQSLHS